MTIDELRPMRKKYVQGFFIFFGLGMLAALLDQTVRNDLHILVRGFQLVALFRLSWLTFKFSRAVELSLAVCVALTALSFFLGFAPVLEPIAMYFVLRGYATKTGTGLGFFLQEKVSA